jgi:predicted AAA+ superfamily ATPase
MFRRNSTVTRIFLCPALRNRSRPPTGTILGTRLGIAGFNPAIKQNPGRAHRLSASALLIYGRKSTNVSPGRACGSGGGFPDSLLVGDEEDSFAWRQDFVQTFIERDIPSLGMLIPAPVMLRLWTMLAHYHGQTVNYSKLAAAVDVSVPTLKKYLAILEQTYMIRLLPPCEANLKKRLIRSPKVYLRDSGILHALLDIDDYDQLIGHPTAGASWEGLALEHAIAAMPRWRPSFIRTSNGAEIDLVMDQGARRVVFEFKLSKAPKPARGFFELVDDLQPERAWIIAPVDQAYPYRQKIDVANLDLFNADPTSGSLN